MNTNAPLAQARLPIERRARVRTEENGTLSEPQPISQFRNARAWVLLGDPGAGKSDVFLERSRTESGVYVSARDFVELEHNSLDANALVFIDGLDEISAGSAYGYTALGQIRGKLQRLGPPRFRIACREADWRGSSDSQALIDLVGAENFLELHLEPLNREETRALVVHWQGSDAERAASFVREAERRDLDGLLDNPQTLRMLVDATASGWPESKTQTYQMACAKLVQEHNEAWLAQTRETAQADDTLLQAAGYLCALMLLSGSASMALQRAGHTHHNLLALPDLPATASAPSQELCRTVLPRRLFRSLGNGEFMPVHRTVAEYLAARYLVQCINVGLPFRRVLALMLGEDGGVVPELRGLHAWLAAAASGNLRAELVEHDPLGIVLYGDVRDFSRPEKLRLLEGLSKEARRFTYFRSQDWNSQPFGALATSNMADDFRGLLKSLDRSHAHLALVDCVLDAMRHGQRMRDLKSELEQIVRDTSYWIDLRTEALQILLVDAQADNQWSDVKQLLKDIHTRKIEDSQDQLLGTLLLVLYPGQIPAAELWSYHIQPKSDAFIGPYQFVWHDLAEKAPTEDIPILLDALIASGFQLQSHYDLLGSAAMVGALLVRGLHVYGLQIDTSRLHRWLSLGLSPDFDSVLEQTHKNAISQWLSEHPDQYKALFEQALQLHISDEKSGWRFWQIQQHLYDAPEPHHADQWYLSLADKAPNDDLRHWLIGMAFDFVRNNSGINAALELLEAWQASHPQDASMVGNFLYCPYPPDESRQKLIASKAKRQQRTEEEEREKVEFFRKTLPSFNTESANLGTLVEVANAYLNFFHNGNEKTPQERLLNLLNQNQEWVELALHGLRQCLLRADLPSAMEIIDLHAKGRRYNIATPCLAAMALRQEEGPATVLALPQEQLERVAAFRLANDYDNPPDWFKQLLATRPEILAGVMQPFIHAQLAARQEHIAGLYALAHSPEYAAVVKLIVPELLHDFPAKAHKKQLESLRLLIIATLTCLDKSVALEIIARKLTSSSLDVAQHVYWLGAGLQLAPELYLEGARHYISQTQARSGHLVSLLLDQRQENRQRIAWPVAVLEFLIALLGPRSNPRQWRSGAGWVTPAMHLGEYVEGLIATLAGIPDEASTHALAALLNENKLTQWSDTLRRAVFDQQITRRKARFKPATVSQVCATLVNLIPANAADLWALTLDHLTQLGRDIRDRNTNGYRQYWDAGKPRHEEECRDTLLFALQPRLAPLSVSAEPEGRYADEKRADIKVMAQGYNIPVEIKRDSHPDLWKAIPEQLIAKYTRDPACDGFGIYLVFWFDGTRQKAAPRDGGIRPKTPQELQQRLASTIPAEHRHKIAVLVLDCAWRPPASS